MAQEMTVTLRIVMVEGNTIRTLDEVNVRLGQVGNTAEQAGKRAGSAFTNLKKRIGGINDWLKIFSANLMALFGTDMLRSIGSVVDEAMRAEQAMMGLAAVARAFGQNAESAQQAARDLAGTGLISMGEAAAALRNLLASGIGLPEAVRFMRLAIDHAKLFRQSHYSVGEAVVATTEGIRNQNSVMSDAIGVTKNLFQFYKEGAESIGKNVQQLSDQEKALIAVRGFMDEMQQTLSGVITNEETLADALAKANQQFRNAAQEVGQALAPAIVELAKATSELAPYISSVAKELAKLIRLAIENKEAVTLLVAVISAYKLRTSSLGQTLAQTTIQSGLLSTTIKKIGSSIKGLSFAGMISGLKNAGAAATTSSAAFAGLAAAIAATGFTVIKWFKEEQNAQLAEMDFIRKSAEAEKRALDILRKMAETSGMTMKQMFKNAGMEYILEKWKKREITAQRLLHEFIKAGKEGNVVVQDARKKYLEWSQSIKKTNDDLNNLSKDMLKWMKTVAQGESLLDFMKRITEDVIKAEPVLQTKYQIQEPEIQSFSKELNDLINDEVEALFSFQDVFNVMKKFGLPTIAQINNEFKNFVATIKTAQLGIKSGAIDLRDYHTLTAEIARRAIKVWDQLDEILKQNLLQTLGVESKKALEKLASGNKKTASNVVVDWNKALEVIARAFGDTFLGRLASTIALFGQSLSDFSGIDDFVNKLKQGDAQAVQALLSIAASVNDLIMSFGDLVGIVDEADKKMIQSLQAVGSAIGALASKALGLPPQVGAVLGQMAGTIVGTIASAFTHSRVSQLMEDAGRKWGKSISEGLAKEISETADEIGNTWAAELLHTADILREVGIDTLEDLNKAAEQTRQILSVLDEGLATEQEAAKSIGESFSEITNAMEEMGVKVNRRVIELIRDVQNRGLEVKEIVEFINQALDETVSGISEWADAYLQLVDAGKAVEGELELMSGMAAKVFAEAIKNGENLVAAIQKIEDPLRKIREAYQKTGEEIPKSLRKLFRLESLIKQNEDLINSIDGMTQALEGLASIGAITFQDFSNAQDVLRQKFDQLTQAGFNQKEALAVIAPQLQLLRDIAQQYGWQLSENTRELIRQAEAQGLLKSKAEEPMNMMIAALWEIVRLLGGEVPESAQKLIDALYGVKDAAEEPKKVIESWRDAIKDSIELTKQLANEMNRTGGMMGSRPPGGGGVRQGGGFQTGGILSISQPTSIIVGEAGPEKVVVIRNPREGKASAPGMNVTIHINAMGGNAKDIARAVREELERLAERGRFRVFGGAITDRR